MLVTRRDGRLVLITQPDHARLAGELAARWGNGRFATPAPREALLCAATHHDDGWLELDGSPAYNAEARRPAHFVELELRQTAGPYGRGVESVYRRDPYAGGLVGMHFSGFYTGRWGLGGQPALENPLAAEVVRTQEARWMPVLREVWGYRGPRSRFDADTWHAYEVLQALDLMSLAIGRLDLEASGVGGGVDGVTVQSTLRSLDQAPGPRLVDAVPRSAGGERVELRLELVAPGRLVVAPYPFTPPEFELTVAARELEDREYAGADEAAAAFHAAPELALTCTIASA